MIPFFLYPGTTTVTVPSSTTNGDSVMTNDIVDELNRQFGVISPSLLAHHVMFCLPPNTMSGIAYAYVNSWQSVYSDDWYVCMIYILFEKTNEGFQFLPSCDMDNKNLSPHY